MPVLGVTGGIATGKTTFVRALLRRLPARGFDADECARELLASDEEVRESVREAFSDAALGSDGFPDRMKLRETVFSDPSKRQALEAILHPRIRAQWTALAEDQRRDEGKGWFVVDIPLLYETGAQSEFERVIAVGCSPATQRSRLQQERGLDPAMIERILAAQWPLERKLAAADHVVWTEGSLAALESQAALIADCLERLHG